MGRGVEPQGLQGVDHAHHAPVMGLDEVIGLIEAAIDLQRCPSALIVQQYTWARMLPPVIGLKAVFHHIFVLLWSRAHLGIAQFLVHLLQTGLLNQQGGKYLALAQEPAVHILEQA